MAKKTGLAGSDDWESFQCDIAVDTISDMIEGLICFRLFLHPFPMDTFVFSLFSKAGFHYEAKTQKREIVMSTTVPYYLEKFEAIVKENGGFFVGGKVEKLQINYY